MPTDVHSIINAQREHILDDFRTLLRIPSISALRTHDEDTKRAAEFAATLLRNAKLEHVEVITTAGAPLVYADWLHAPGKPTVLLYAHYDVQPVDPLSEWHTDPFEPQEQGDLIYGRGVCDDKNQLVATVHAVGAMLEANAELPVNVRFLFEGEEESGGTAIEHFVTTESARLTSDIVVIADGSMLPGHPVVHYGCRGIIYTEILAQGAAHDLHSGGYGGVAPNPLFALAAIITGLKAPDGQITIPGLYELVAPPTAAELELWQPIAQHIEQQLRAEMGTDQLTGEDLPPLERVWARPTLEVHGFVGGFQDEGTKTVIPAAARVKVSLRLVPDQTAENVLPLLAQRVAALTPPGIHTEVRMVNSGLPFLTASDSAAIVATSRALSASFGTTTWLARTGGSVPIATVLQHTLQAQTFCLGFGLPGDGAHAPNEHTSIANFLQSVHAFAAMIESFGAL